MDERVKRFSTMLSVLAGLVLALNVVSVGHALAQNCSPPPPGCQRANDRATQFINRLQAGGVSGIVDAASQQYCTLLIGIEVNNFCAAEYRRIGKANCASLLTQQSAQYRQALPQTEAAASAASIRNARNKCSFE